MDIGRFRQCAIHRPRPYVAVTLLRLFPAFAKNREPAIRRRFNAGRGDTACHTSSHRGLSDRETFVPSITVPWVEKDPGRFARYRAQASKILLTLGVLQAIVVAIAWKGADLSNTDRFSDWKVIIAWAFVIGPAIGAVTCIAGGLTIIAYKTVLRILKMTYVPMMLFNGGLVAVGLLVWAHGWLFQFIKATIASGTATHEVLGLSYPLTVGAIYDALVERGLGCGLLAYALWPLQFDFIRDIVAVGGIIGFISIIPAFGIWWERKIAGRIQSRLGPMRTGGWHGWLQSPADGIKLLFKEDLVPPDGDPTLFRLATYLAFVPPICAFIALPFAGAWVFRDLDVALIFILAMLGIEVVGVIIAGWASNNKWSVYGAMREACQMVSYEIPMGMSLLIPVMMAGTLQLTALVNAQAGGFTKWFVFANPWCFVAFFTYYIASLASCKRAPFDLPESESELVAGFHTEYSGFRWSLFFFAEYAAMFAVSGIAVILFLGGWKSPFPESWAPASTGFFALLIKGLFFEGPIIFIVKAGMLYYVQLWVRWTLPRIRIDQVLYGCVQVLLPLTMVMLLANTLWMLGIEQLHWGWLIAVDAVLHWILVAIGVVTVLSLIGIAAHGYRNNKKLVGTLAVDALPGA